VTDAEPAANTGQPRTWRPMAMWSAGILLALGLVWFVTAVVVPVWQVRKIAPLYTPPSYDGMDSFLWELDWGQFRQPYWGDPAPAKNVELYLRMPDWVAPSKESAVCMLYDCGQGGVPVLARALENRRVPVRMASAVVLRRFGPRACQAVPALVRKLEDEDSQVRAVVASALRKFQGEEAGSGRRGDAGTR